MKRFSKRKKALGLFLIGNLLPIGYVLWMCFAPPRAITISEETTYITEPLTPDGKYVDYLAYAKSVIGDRDYKDDLWRAMVLPARPNAEPSEFAVSQVPCVTYVDPLEETKPGPDASGDAAYRLRLNAHKRFGVRMAAPFDRVVDEKYATIVGNNEHWYEAITTVDYSPIAVWWTDDLDETVLPLNGVHHKVVDRFLLRMSLAFGEGNLERVAASFRFIQNVSERERSQQFTVNQLSADGMLGSGISNLCAGLHKLDALPESWLRDLDKLGPDPRYRDRWSQAIDIDRLTWLAELQKLHRSRAVRGYFTKYTDEFGDAAGNWFTHRLDFEELMRVTNSTYDKGKAAFDTANPRQGLDTIAAHLKASGKQFPKPPNFGSEPTWFDLAFADHTGWLRFEMSQQVDVFRHCLESVAEMQNRWRQLRLAIRLHVYRKRHGVWPESLTEITTLEGWEVDPSVIIDSFSNKQFRYRRTDKGFILYSVGSNQIDESQGLNLHDAEVMSAHSSVDDDIQIHPDPRHVWRPRPIEGSAAPAMR